MTGSKLRGGTDKLQAPFSRYLQVHAQVAGRYQALPNRPHRVNLACSLQQAWGFVSSNFFFLFFFPFFLFPCPSGLTVQHSRPLCFLSLRLVSSRLVSFFSRPLVQSSPLLARCVGPYPSILICSSWPNSPVLATALVPVGYRLPPSRSGHSVFSPSCTRCPRPLSLWPATKSHCRTRSSS